MKYIGHICLATCMFCALICSCHSIPDWKRSKLNLDPCLKHAGECWRLCPEQGLLLCSATMTCSVGTFFTADVRTGVCVCVCVCARVCVCVNLNACIRDTNNEVRTPIHVVATLRTSLQVHC